MVRGVNFSQEEYNKMLAEYGHEYDTSKDYTELEEEIISYCIACEAVQKTITPLFDVYYYFGTSGVNPYLVFFVLNMMNDKGLIEMGDRRIHVSNVIKRQKRIEESCIK